MDNETMSEMEMQHNMTESNVITTVKSPAENDFSNMTHAIVEWRRIQTELSELRQQVREKNKRSKALEEVILNIMKSKNIGALDLKNSGGRILFKRQKRHAGLGKKNLHKLMSDFLKSDQKATEALNYINENRDIIVKESLMYEKVEIDA
jgi:hypothetical protein